MEIAEEGLARLMWKWVSEESVYLDSKRKQGNHNPGEEQRIQRELQIHELDGNNVEDWFSLMEDTFHYYQFDEETGVKATILALNDELRTWFEGERGRVHQWSDLRRLLRYKLGVDADEGRVEEGDVEEVGFKEGSVTGEGRDRVDSRVLKKEGRDQTLNTQKTTVTMAVLQNQKEKVEEEEKVKEIEISKGKGNIPGEFPMTFLEHHEDGGGMTGNYSLQVTHGSSAKRKEKSLDGGGGVTGEKIDNIKEGRRKVLEGTLRVEVNKQERKRQGNWAMVD